MIALPDVLNGIVLVRLLTANDTIVRNFQPAFERLNHCAEVQAHRITLHRLDGCVQSVTLLLQQDEARRPHQPASGQGGRESGCGSGRGNQPGDASPPHRLSGGLFMSETTQITPVRSRPTGPFIAFLGDEARLKDSCLINNEIGEKVMYGRAKVASSFPFSINLIAPE